MLNLVFNIVEGSILKDINLNVPNVIISNLRFSPFFHDLIQRFNMFFRKVKSRSSPTKRSGEIVTSSNWENSKGNFGEIKSSFFSPSQNPRNSSISATNNNSHRILDIWFLFLAFLLGIA